MTTTNQAYSRIMSDLLVIARDTHTTDRNNALWAIYMATARHLGIPIERKDGGNHTTV